MNKGYTQRIRERVLESEDGSVFTTSDFSDIADNNTIRQNMLRLVKEGVLRRIMNGVFEKPKYSKLLDEYIAVSPDEVAKALARSYNWTIAPSGNTALNMMGVSTQIPAVWSYISDGPYRNYECGSIEIEFKHRTNKEISGLSYKTALLVQVIKALGKDGISQEMIKLLSNKLTEEEKTIAKDEAAKSRDWVYSTIKRICEEDAA